MRNDRQTYDVAEATALLALLDEAGLLTGAWTKMPYDELPAAVQASLLLVCQRWRSSDPFR